MKRLGAALALLIGILFGPNSNAEQAASIDIHQLSPNYDAKARSEPSYNDIASFVYGWFAGFDHQREPAFFLPKIAAPVHLHYPNTPLKSIEDFLCWYQSVMDSVVWNTHQLSELQIQGDSQLGWQVSYQVRWQARGADGDHFDIQIQQRLKIIEELGQLKIAQLRAQVLTPDA